MCKVNLLLTDVHRIGFTFLKNVTDVIPPDPLLQVYSIQDWNKPLVNNLSTRLNKV